MIFNRQRKQRQSFLDEFGDPKADPPDFKSIEDYFRKKDNSSALQVISDKTCHDLDFNELFLFLDRTNSKVGQQYFYNKLRTIPTSSKANATSEKLISRFTNDPGFRVSTQMQLNKLNKREAFYISSLFQDELIKPPTWHWIVPLLSFSSFFSLIAMFFIPQLFLIFFVVFIVNAIIHYLNKKNLLHYLASIPQLLMLTNVAKELFKDQQLKEINPDLEKSISTMSKVRASMSFFDFETKIQSDAQMIFWAILELLKIVFLLEPLLLFASLKKLDTKRKEIEDLFLFVGKIDSQISIASLRKGSSNYCIPTITDKEKTMVAKEVYHPLINNCVRNSLSIENKSILLTGSNMSGKTSFIRTIGINFITALTINTCFAIEFSIPRTKIFSAIRISDDLMNDKSYYFEEVLTIKEMIDQREHLGVNLFLLDELFKGTNTVERIAAGKAVLSGLVKNNNIVFISTHDIELTDLLTHEYDLYHFSEAVDNKKVDFDYKLREGKLRNRNAIKILQLNNYPKDLVAEAMELFEKLDKTNA